MQCWLKAPSPGTNLRKDGEQTKRAADSFPCGEQFGQDYGHGGHCG